MNVHILKRWGGANQRFAYAFAVENAILTSHESLLPLSNLHPPFSKDKTFFPVFQTEKQNSRSIELTKSKLVYGETQNWFVHIYM